MLKLIVFVFLGFAWLCASFSLSAGFAWLCAIFSLSAETKLFRTHRNGHQETSADETPQSKIRISNPNITKFLELILVVDKTKHESLGNNPETTIRFCQNLTNIVNWLYQPLNISVALVQVVIWSERDEIEISPEGSVTLNHFLDYRRTKLNPKYPNDNAQLITGKYLFDNGVLAKSLNGPICTHQYSGGVIGGLDGVPLLTMAQVVAHTIGHNIGMEHDQPSCACPADLCIMSAEFNRTFTPTKWSECSQNDAKKAFKQGMDYCLRNEPKSLFGGPVCGNGYVESGEECDCGPEEYCDSHCCDAASCRLKEGASCDAGECCDKQTCQVISQNTKCRPSRGECDLPEFCDTRSPFCPEDKFKMDAELCGTGEAFCYQGTCKSRTDQCKLLWGDSGIDATKTCYSVLNMKGSKHGHCGYNSFNDSYRKCDEVDKTCGLLHCVHQADGLRFGLEITSIIRQSFVNLNGSIHACRSASIDLGTQLIDPGMVPDGAKCGENMMCLNQRCRHLNEVRNGV